MKRIQLTETSVVFLTLTTSTVLMVASMLALATTEPATSRLSQMMLNSNASLIGMACVLATMAAGVTAIWGIVKPAKSQFFLPVAFGMLFAVFLLPALTALLPPVNQWENAVKAYRTTLKAERSGGNLADIMLLRKEIVAMSATPALRSKNRETLREIAGAKTYRPDVLPWLTAANLTGMGSDRNVRAGVITKSTERNIYASLVSGAHSANSDMIAAMAMIGRHTP